MYLYQLQASVEGEAKWKEEKAALEKKLKEQEDKYKVG